KRLRSRAAGRRCGFRQRPDAGARGLTLQPDPALVLFCGGMGGSAVEDALADALRECALDTLDEARSTGAYAAYVLVLDEASAGYFEGRLPAGVVVEVDAPGRR